MLTTGLSLLAIVFSCETAAKALVLAFIHSELFEQYLMNHSNIM